MAACTSRAAASMLRLRSNCSTIPVFPSWLDEVIWLTPAMRPNCRSSGVATADAMVCGSAPGSEAPTLITGKSILGREATGRKLNARIPDSSSAAASSDVPIGLRIKGPEMFIVPTPGRRFARQLRPGPNPGTVHPRGFEPLRLIRRHRLRRNLIADPVPGEPLRQPVEPQIHHRGGVERKQLAQEQPADDRDSQRAPELGPGPG